MKTMEEIYKTYEKPIFHYFYGLTGNTHLAEELTQETFFQVLRTFSGFRGEAQVTTWLYKVARNVYSMWKRKQKASFPLPEAELLKGPASYEPDTVLEFKEKLTLTGKVLQELPENYREVFWLREWHELAYEQIAVIMGKSVPWVKVTLHRARLQFRKNYAEKEGKE